MRSNINGFQNSKHVIAVYHSTEAPLTSIFSKYFIMTYEELMDASPDTKGSN
jgi:hypothetical protein